MITMFLIYLNNLQTPFCPFQICLFPFSRVFERVSRDITVISVILDRALKKWFGLETEMCEAFRA